MRRQRLQDGGVGQLADHGEEQHAEAERRVDQPVAGLFQRRAAQQVGLRDAHVFHARHGIAARGTAAMCRRATRRGIGGGRVAHRSAAAPLQCRATAWRRARLRRRHRGTACHAKRRTGVRRTRILRRRCRRSDPSGHHDWPAHLSRDDRRRRGLCRPRRLRDHRRRSRRRCLRNNGGWPRRRLAFWCPRWRRCHGHLGRLARLRLRRLLRRCCRMCLGWLRGQAAVPPVSAAPPDGAGPCAPAPAPDRAAARRQALARPADGYRGPPCW